MDWQNEHYVRLYTRDSTTWAMWHWETRALLCLLLRVVDRAGVLDIGQYAPTFAVAAVTGMPEAVVAEAMCELEFTGTIEVENDHLRVVNFAAAQGARSTGASRQRLHRDRKRALARMEAL